MVLAKDIYNDQGYKVLDMGTELTHDTVSDLKSYRIGEVIVQDDRLSDVNVSYMFPPETEGKATQALNQLMAESQFLHHIDEDTSRLVEEPILEMIRELFPEPLGEINATGCTSLQEYRCSQPVKTAGLSLLMGRRLGYKIVELNKIGMAALLKDIGFIVLGESVNDRSGSSVNPKQAKQHPQHGARMMVQSKGFSPDVIEAVLQHHERWDGSGYPRNLKGDNISEFARIVSLADSYYELVSVRPDRRALLPHEAVEYIMAFSGEFFDPKMVKLLAREVPLYPTGLMVKLNTGHMGIISDSNIGHVGRPVVRICFNSEMREESQPYDFDLSDPRHQKELISQVMEY